MRDLQRLNAAESTPEVPRRRSASSPLARSLFAIGLAVLVAFSAAGAAFFAWAGRLRTEPPRAEIEALNRQVFEEIDQENLAEFWTRWQEEVVGQPPGRWIESEFVANRHLARFRRRFGIGLFVVAGLGLAAMLGSLTLRR